MRVFVLQSSEQGTAGDVIELDDDIAKRHNKANYTMETDEPLSKQVAETEEVIDEPTEEIDETEQ